MPVFAAQRWEAVARTAARQHGYLTRADLVAAGFSRGMIDAAVESHRLIRVGEGVFALGYVPLAQESRWAAAVLAGGDDALLSHRSAATLWRIRSGEGPRVDVTVATRNGRAREGILFHRTGVEPQDRARHRGIRSPRRRGRSSTSPGSSTSISSSGH